jgi:hypothetical protein
MTEGTMQMISPHLPFFRDLPGRTPEVPAAGPKA